MSCLISFRMNKWMKSMSELQWHTFDDFYVKSITSFCGSLLPVFGVKVSVMFHLMLVHYTFSSV